MLRKIKKGQKIFSQNDKSREMYFIQSGVVEIQQVQNKNTIHLARLEKGAIFGEMAVIAGLARTATAVAEEDSELQVITEDDFKKRIETVPPWYMALLRVSCERLKQINQKLNSEQSRLVTYAHAARLLLMICSRMQADAPDDAQENADLKFVKMELVDILSLSRKTVTDALDFFKRKDMIRVAENRCSIPDKKLLAEYAAFLKHYDPETAPEPVPNDVLHGFELMVAMFEKKYRDMATVVLSYGEFTRIMGEDEGLTAAQLELLLNEAHRQNMVKYILSNGSEGADLKHIDENTQLSFDFPPIRQLLNRELFTRLGI